MGLEPALSPELADKLNTRLVEKASRDPLLREVLFQEEEGPSFRSLSVALLNALSQSLLTPAHLTPKGVGVIRGRYPVELLEGRGTRATVIGCGGYLTDLCHAPFIEEIVVCDLAFQDPAGRAFFQPYLEQVVYPAQKSKKITLLDGSDNESSVRQADFVFITGSSLVNDSLLDLLLWAEGKPAVLLEGNTAGLYPFPLLERGVTHLVQTVVDIDFARLSHRFAQHRREGILQVGDAEYCEILLPEMRTLQKLPTFDLKRERGSRDKKILLLQARNWGDPMIEHEIHCFRERIPDQYELACYNIVDGPWDASVLDGFQAVMVGGSGEYGAAFNDNPWFQPTLGLLRAIVNRGLPLFCSCWGHEALAVALGGTVVLDHDGYELGVLDLALTGEGAQDPLFSTLPQHFRAPLGHSEQVGEMPPDSVLLASTDRCRVQAYRLKDRPVYSCQFHPELTHERLWERVDAYIPHLNDQGHGPQAVCTENLIARFLEIYVDKLGRSGL